MKKTVAHNRKEHPAVPPKTVKKAPSMPKKKAMAAKKGK